MAQDETKVSLLLEARGLCYKYTGGFALRDVNLRLYSGRVTLLRGEAGAGKSTLLSLLSARLSATSGVLVWRGRVLNLSSAQGVARWRRQLALSGNGIDLPMDRSPRELLLFLLAGRGVLRATARRECVRVLTTLGLLPLADQSLSRLSAGQTRLAAIAAAFVTQAPLMLLDEPLRELDQKARERVMQLIHDRARGGSAVLLVSHDPHMEESVDTIITMREGTLEGDE